MRASKCTLAHCALRLGLGWWAGLLPAAGLTFLCFAKEKVSKRKASQVPWPYRLPCATRIARGRAQTRYAQTSARPEPCAAALLSAANGLASPNIACACSLRSPCTRPRTIAAIATGGAEASPILKRQASFMNPFTTTATLTNLGEQTCTATSRTNATIRYKKSQIGC